MPDQPLQIQPSTKVAQLLDAYPELEDVLVRMAPPFKKLRNPILRRSIAKVASLKQASVVGRLDLTSMINQLREVVGQAPLGSTEVVSEEEYLGTAPDWFDASCVGKALDDRDGDPDVMAITRVLSALKEVGEHQAVELTTTFLPAPGIDAARAKGLLVWMVQEQDELFKTYFARSD